jgi:hypothetical protein
MRTNQDIEGYLIKMGVRYQELAEGTWVIHDDYEAIDNIVVNHSAPIVLFRVKLLEVPKDGDLVGLFRLLLELNATEMVTGAYGIEGNAIVAMDTLQSENLDFNEFQAVVDGLSMCISDHYERLVKYVKPGSGAQASAAGKA